MKNLFSYTLDLLFKSFLTLLFYALFSMLLGAFLPISVAVVVPAIVILFYWNNAYRKSQRLKKATKIEVISDDLSIKKEEIDLDISQENHPEHFRIKGLYERLKTNIYGYERIAVEDKVTGQLLKKYALSIDEKVDFDYRVIKEVDFYVSGLKYHDYTNKKFKYILSTLDLPYKVSLIPEPDNEFDQCAILIKVKSYTLGYVPRSSGPPYYIENGDVIDSINQGNNVEAYIIEYDESEILEERVKLSIKY